MNPQAGHAVRLTKDAYWAKAGTYAIIDGEVGRDIGPDERMLIVFHCIGGAFRGGQHAGSKPEFVACSGGPAFYITRARDLEGTDGTVRFPFWRWLDYPRHGGGEVYYLEVPVWNLRERSAEDGN